MSTATVATDPNLSLARLQLIIQQQEGIFGPLTALDHANGRNVLEFEIAAKPKVRAVLKAPVQDPPAPRKGYELVCHGECFIANKKTRVGAFRGKAK